MSKNIPIPFQPDVGKTVKLTPTTSNSAGTVQVPFGQIRVYNAGTAMVFFRYGIGAQTAVVATDMPIAAGATEAFSVPADTTGVAAICEVGSASVYVTPGCGS
jgi:hypothetical protein